MLEESNIPPEIVVRAREAEVRGEFNKRIIKSVPIPSAFQTDTVTLECGHTTVGIGKAVERAYSLECSDCRKEWIRTQVEQLKR